MKPILQKDEKILREIAEDVPVDKISSAKIQRIISEIKVALESQDDGVAIAAPQIGYSLRIFVISPKVENIIKKESRIPPERSVGNKSYKAPATTVFINPTLKKISKEKNMVEEGCLSVRYLYGKVSRSKKAEIVAYDENGKKFMKG